MIYLWLSDDNKHNVMHLHHICLCYHYPYKAIIELLHSSHIIDLIFIHKDMERKTKINNSSMWQSLCAKPQLLMNSLVCLQPCRKVNLHILAAWKATRVLPLPLPISITRPPKLLLRQIDTSS